MGSGVIVADTNVVAYFLIPGTATADAERVRSKDHDWVSPNLLRYEWMNVVGQHVRTKRIERDIGLKLYRRGLALARFEDLPSDPLSILKMCEATGSSPYDLEYVWLAMELGVPLVTADQHVVRAYPEVAVHLGTFGK
jgi:predicted nucleic acid-binding protein